MTRERNQAAGDDAKSDEAARGPDETGVGASSKSSPQGDGAEKAPARPARPDQDPPVKAQ